MKRGKLKLGKVGNGNIQKIWEETASQEEWRGGRRK